MTLLCVGLDHRATPMPVLSRAGLDAGRARSLLLDVADDEFVAEALVLSTCNRLEIYADVDRFHPAVDAITTLAAKHTGMDRDRLVEHLRVRYDEAAVTHLLSVTAGLESVVPGETQVLGQVRSALRIAQDEGTAGRVLNGVVQTALRSGKRVHTETAVASAGASVVTAGLDLAAPAIGGLAGKRALVVGAGAMGVLAAATLRRAGVASLVVANRTLEHAERIASNYEGHAAALDELPALLAEADVIVTAVGAGQVLIGVSDLQVRADAATPLAIVDLALPSDTAVAVGALPGVVRVDLETLHDTAATHASTADLAAAQTIVRDDVTEYIAATAARSVEPTLVALRARAAEVVAAESTRLRSRLTDLTPEQLDEVERSLRRAAGALLHTPTVRIKEYAIGPEGSAYAEALRALFDLDPSVVDSVGTPGVLPGSTT
jgi:glutamyl-tRNA reductase